MIGRGSEAMTGCEGVFFPITRGTPDCSKSCKLSIGLSYSIEVNVDSRVDL